MAEAEDLNIEHKKTQQPKGDGPKFLSIYSCASGL